MSLYTTTVGFIHSSIVITPKWNITDNKTQRTKQKCGNN